MKDQATNLAQAIIEQATNRAIYGADKARGAASSAKGRVPIMRKKPVEELPPTIREIAFQAAAAALELWQTARERAESAVETAEQRVGEPAAEAVKGAGRSAKSAASNVVGIAGDATERAKNVATQAVERGQDATDKATDRAKLVATQVVERGQDATGKAKNIATQVAGHAENATVQAKSAATNVVDHAGDATDRAKEVTKSAAGATVSTSKDTGAALFWTAAAAGIVFYVLLDKDRRDQVLKALDSALVQARELIRDYQGYDEQFV
jgi:hypothetical protein